MPVLTESVAGYVSGISAIVEACQPLTLSLWGLDCVMKENKVKDFLTDGGTPRTH